MFPLQCTCSCFTYIQTNIHHTLVRTYKFHLSSLHICLPSRANGEFIFKGLFTTVTHTHTHRDSHTCVARSLRGWPLIRRCVMGGLSLGCMFCICMCVTAAHCLSLSIHRLWAWLHGCVCVHVPPLIIFSFDNAWRFHIAHSLALIYAAAAGAAVAAAAAFGCPFWSFCVFYSSIKLAIICFFYWFFKWALCVVSNYEFSIDLKSTIYIHTYRHT